ncbi:unnamed protein product [Rodentolepis nana]|uniref:Uncharacterized protein n=1 Tax=Rodentolepis nana TaxID=102285 RepID=A0A0R3T6Y4_RODNA|nr:unnamed protein product [Rodentolepis nana]
MLRLTVAGRICTSRINAQSASSPLYIQQRERGFTEVDRAGGRNKAHRLEELIRWYLRLKPWREEIATLMRRLKRHNAGFDVHHSCVFIFWPGVHGQTRYLVRFPQLTDSDFEYWKVYTDADFDEGYSKAEFVRSSRYAAGATVQRDSRELNSEFINTRVSGDAKNLLSPGEKDAHPYSIMYSADR